MAKDPVKKVRVWLSWMDGPWGPIWVGSTEEGVCGVELRGGREELERDLSSRKACEFEVDFRVNERVLCELDEYFSGKRREFDVLLDPWGSRFDLTVWQALMRIPYGQTRSYKSLALEVGVPMGARAVGRATGRNPIPILIPCHRLIMANGQLGGFGSGIDLKKALLLLEKKGLRPKHQGVE